MATEMDQFITALLDGLGEKPGTPAHAQIVRAVAVLQAKPVMQIAHRALEIYNGRGMLTIDKTRKRSLGGVFFILLKRACTDEQFEQIFQRKRVPFKLPEKPQPPRKPAPQPRGKRPMPNRRPDTRKVPPKQPVQRQATRRA